MICEDWGGAHKKEALDLSMWIYMPPKEFAEIGPYFQVRTFLSISMPVQKPLCPIMHVLHDRQYKVIAT